MLAGVATGMGVGVAGCVGSSSQGETPVVDTTFECEINGEDGTPVGTLPQPSLGDREAPVTVDIFEDYDCHYCADFSLNTMPQLREKYLTGDMDGVARFRFFDFPIPTSEWSQPIANVGRSVQHNQGQMAYWEVNKALYKIQGEYSWERVGGVASSVSEIEPCTLLRDGYNETFSEVIKSNKSTGERRGIEGTPSVFVNQEPVAPEKSWFAAVDRNIQSQL